MMSGRCSKILRIVSGSGDGKRNDDPEEANTEKGTFIALSLCQMK